MASGRVVVGRLLLRGPSGFQGRTLLLLRHVASLDLPDEHDGGDPWEVAVQFLLSHVITP